jgi:hypothetical protein
MTPYWRPGQRVHSYVRDTGRHMTVRGYLNIPIQDTLLKLFRKKGDKRWRLMVMGEEGEMVLPTENVDEAKATAIAIWRMK